MPTTKPTTTYYRELLQACSEELQLLGYAAGTARLGGAGEFLSWLEAEGLTKLAGVERADIERYLDHLRQRPSRQGGSLSPYTIGGYVFSLRLLFDYAERHGLRGGSPLAGLRLPKLPKAERYVATPEEIKKLYAAASENGRLIALLHLLYGCGLRRMEAEALNLRDVNGRGGLLYVRRGKGRRRRVIPLSEGVRAGLQDYRLNWRWRYVRPASGAAFLLNDRGGRLRGGSMSRRLINLVEAAEVDRRITPHGLRHAIATHLLAGGMDLERVRDFLGHAHLETTQLYTRVNPADL